MLQKGTFFCKNITILSFFKTKSSNFASKL